MQVINTRHNDVLYDKFKEETPSQNRNFACCHVSVFTTVQISNKKKIGTKFLKSNYSSSLSDESSSCLQ